MVIIGRGKGEGQDGGGDLEVQTTMHKINKPQEYIVQHREHSQYFIIIINGI